MGYEVEDPSTRGKPKTRGHGTGCAKGLSNMQIKCGRCCRSL